MSPSGGPIEIFVKVGNGTGGTIVIAGAIGDHGKILSPSGRTENQIRTATSST